MQPSNSSETNLESLQSNPNSASVTFLHVRTENGGGNGGLVKENTACRGLPPVVDLIRITSLSDLNLAFAMSLE